MICFCLRLGCLVNGMKCIKINDCFNKVRNSGVAGGPLFKERTPEGGRSLRFGAQGREAALAGHCAAYTTIVYYREGN